MIVSYSQNFSENLLKKTPLILFQTAQDDLNNG